MTLNDPMGKNQGDLSSAIEQAISEVHLNESKDLFINSRETALKCAGSPFQQSMRMISRCITPSWRFLI